MNMSALFTSSRSSRKCQQTDDDAESDQLIDQSTSLNMMTIIFLIPAETLAAHLLKSQTREEKIELIAEQLQE